MRSFIQVPILVTIFSTLAANPAAKKVCGTSKMAVSKPVRITDGYGNPANSRTLFTSGCDGKDFQINTIDPKTQDDNFCNVGGKIKCGPGPVIDTWIWKECDSDMSIKTHYVKCKKHDTGTTEKCPSAKDAPDMEIEYCCDY